MFRPCLCEGLPCKEHWFIKKAIYRLYLANNDTECPSLRLHLVIYRDDLFHSGIGTLCPGSLWPRHKASQLSPVRAARLATSRCGRAKGTSMDTIELDAGTHLIVPQGGATRETNVVQMPSASP